MEDLEHVLEVGLDGPVTARRQADESGLRGGGVFTSSVLASLTLSQPFFP